MRLRVWAFRYAGARPQSVVANVNGTDVGTIELDGAPVVWELHVRKGTWKEGKNVLRFDCEYAESPAGRVPVNTDPRTLAVAFDWLEIIPL